MPVSTSPEIEAQLIAHENVVYAKHGNRELALDLYRPKSADAAVFPAIVFIQGGGWWQGNRSNHCHLAKALAAKGYVAATISYRLSGEAPFPAQIHDCKAAARFLRVNAKRFGINSDKIGAIGLSAGGHLTALWKKQLPSATELLRRMALPGPDRLYTKALHIPSGTHVYDKTGSTAMCCGDMGILVAQGTNGRSSRYVVGGVIDSTVRVSSYGSWIARCADVIREVSNLTYAHLKKRYPLR